VKIVLPKASRGLVFDRLLPIEMNDFDIERLLPALFYLVVTGGSQRRERVNDPTALSTYIDRLSTHRLVRGFDGNEGRSLLDRWVRASVIRVSRVGTVRGSEQIEHVLPLTLLAYKPGFPAETSRQRRVHTFIYKILIDALRIAEVKPSPAAVLRMLFQSAFGAGVELEDSATYDGRYDGRAELDIHSLLCLHYLDGFKAAPARPKDAPDERSVALIGAALDLAEDLLGYIKVYASQMPPLALTRGLGALIGIGLFAYTRRLSYATNGLVQTGKLNPNPPPFYVDFTRSRGGPSEELARTSVERDLEEMRVFFESSLLLRTIDRFVQNRPDLRERLASVDTPQYLEALVELRDHPRIEARAEQEIESVRDATLEACESQADRDDAEALFRSLEGRYPNAMLRAAKVLALAQERSGVQKYIYWYWSIAGLTKPYGVLAGGLRGRRSWRYSMGDDLLATLVHVAMLQARGAAESTTARPRLRLSEFVRFLEERFGILVDRPPQFLDTAASRAAAKENATAMRARLRQMGFFEALSDDFNAQYLTLPEMAQANA
jgi:hypothetical protein